MSEHDKLREALALANDSLIGAHEHHVAIANAAAHIEAQAAEIADLRKGIMRRDDAVVVPLALWEEMDLVGLQWKAKAEAAEANARRYLWLREDKSRGAVDHCVCRIDWTGDRSEPYAILTEAEADAAIDDAMRGGAE